MTEISNITLSFKNEIIFNDFSLKITGGEKIAVTGESGIGKTTLLNLLAGFIPEYNGKIIVSGRLLSQETISEIRKNISWLPQDISLAVKTAKELFYSPFEFNLNKKHRPTQKELSEIFSEFELSENLLEKKINEISGGQKQRILLASCLLLKKPLILADEPTSALDEKNKKKITDYLLNQRGITIIAVTHDEYWIKKCDRVIELKQKRLRKIETD